jgi:fructokinase
VQAKRLVGAIEGGGTKFVCAVATSPTDVLERAVLATRDPAETLSACAEFLGEAAARHGEIAAIGLACFGPLQLRPGAQDYGCLLKTPKSGWSGVNLLLPFRRRFGVPIVLATDVAAAACGELAQGAGRGLGSLAYVTVGTGIGGAVAPAPQAPRLMHAEMGHLVVRRDPRDAGFRGTCPFHEDCLEGLASGPAVRARWGTDLDQLPADHSGRDLIAGYVAQLLVAIALLHAPQRIVVGGGVMGQGALLPGIRKQTLALLSGYLPALGDAEAMEQFIQTPMLATESAIVGALHMTFDGLSNPETMT